MTRASKTITRSLIFTLCAFLIIEYAHARPSANPGLFNLNPHAMPLPEDVPAGHLLHDITFNQASQLLYDFLSTDTFFYAARNWGYSGMLSKQTLATAIPSAEGDQETSGLLFYLCRDVKSRLDPTDDELFLAFKKVVDFTQTVAIPVPAENEEFYKTNSILTYRGTVKPSEQDVKTSLIADFDSQNSANEVVSGRYVLDCSNDFMAFKAKDEISAQDVTCNDYSFGFIPLGELNLLREPVDVDQADFVGVRFYFGYDSSENLNRIRVFFVGSLTKSNYIISSSQANKTKFARIIERSRP